MEPKLLIDTNVIIDYLAGKLPAEGLDFIDKVIEGIPVISIINKVELLGHNHPSLHQCKLFVGVCHILELTEQVVDITITIRKSRKIKIPDAIVAATALVYDLIVITHNVSDFEGIAKLSIIDPYQLKDIDRI